MDLNIPLLPVQREFLEAKEDFVAIISGRSCGKTWIGVLDALMEVLRGNNILYMCQNDGAWYKGGWVHLQAFLRKFNLLDYWSWNGTYKTGTLCGNKWYVGTYENVDGARGATECSTLYLDELCLSKPEIMAALAPCLRGKDKQGNDVNPRIRGFSTPNMQSLWQVMLAENEKYGIRILRAKQSDNTFLTEKQKAVMNRYIFDDKLRRQEIDGEIILGEDATSLINLREFPREPAYFSDDRVYAGLDMAHKGQRDSHSFAAIKGNRLVAFHEFGICNPIDVAMWIKRFNEKYPIFSLNMDLAWSDGIMEHVQYKYACRQISFAEKAPTEIARKKFANIRAYGYFHLADLHREGLCVDVESEFIDSDIVSEYKREITNTHFILAKDGRLLIEDKDDIRARLGRSPDPADALMLAGLDRITRVDPVMAAAETHSGLTRAEEEAIMSEY